MEAQELSQALNSARPVMAASILKTFGKITALLFGFAWMICMPIEMILHRRIGKRYCNTFFVAMSLVVLGFMSYACIGVAQFARLILLDSTAVSKAQASGPRGALVDRQLSLDLIRNPSLVKQKAEQAAMEAMRPSLIAFGLLNILAMLAFAAHYIANRRRFGTQEQGHSCDFGIPWLIYPPLAAKLIPPKPRLRLQPRQGRLEPLPLARSHSYPLQIIRQLREAVTHHLNCLRRGEIPHGPFNWLYLMYGEPALLALIGAAMFIGSASIAAFGLYLVVVALGLWFKGLAHQAEWRERAYDDMDNKLESEALRAWRSGSHASAIARQFTVPITTAILAKRVARGDEPVMVGPDFDHVLTPEARDEQRAYRNAI